MTAVRAFWVGIGLWSTALHFYLGEPPLSSGEMAMFAALALTVLYVGDK